METRQSISKKIYLVTMKDEVITNRPTTLINSLRCLCWLMQHVCVCVGTRKWEKSKKKGLIRWFNWKQKPDETCNMIASQCFHEKDLYSSMCTQCLLKLHLHIYLDHINKLLLHSMVLQSEELLWTLKDLKADQIEKFQTLQSTILFLRKLYQQA